MNAEVLTHGRFPPAAASLVFARLLDRHSPGEIAQAIEVLIDLCDLLDGDPDLEAEPDAEEDDPSGQCDEDGINTALGNVIFWQGPGCPLGDGEVALP